MNQPTCKMPWSALTITGRGQIKPCCQLKGDFGNIHNGDRVSEAIHSDDWKAFRKAHLNGEIPDPCRACNKREQILGQSRRTWFEEKFSKYVSSDTFTENPTNNYAQIDLNLSNHCNLKCRMCGSWGSNKWIPEEKKFAVHKHLRREGNPDLLKSFELSKDQIDDLLPLLDSVKRIDFKGGEPLLAANHSYVLEKLIERGRHKDLTLHYTSNGTFVNPQLLQLLKKFKQVQLVFSIEGTGGLYSYIRGGRYDINNLVENLHQYDSLENVRISFNVAIQIYNVLNLRKLHDFLHALKFERGSAKGAFSYTLVVEPPYLSPLIAPTPLLEKAAQQIEGIDEMNYLREQMMQAQFDPDLWARFCHFTDLLDQSRDEKIFDVIPEFRDYWSRTYPLTQQTEQIHN